MRPLFFFFFFSPHYLFLSPAVHTFFFFSYGRPPSSCFFGFLSLPPRPVLAAHFLVALFSRCRPVHHPLPEKDGNCSVGTLLLPCADSAWECPHHCFPTTTRAAATCTHTRTPRERYMGGIRRVERSCAVPCAGPILLSTGLGGTGGKVVCCFVLHWTKKLLYFVFHVQPCLVLSPHFLSLLRSLVKLVFSRLAERLEWSTTDSVHARVCILT